MSLTLCVTLLLLKTLLSELIEFSNGSICYMIDVKVYIGANSTKKMTTKPMP